MCCGRRTSASGCKPFSFCISMDVGRPQVPSWRQSGEKSRLGQKCEPSDGPGTPGLTAASWGSLVCRVIRTRNSGPGEPTLVAKPLTARWGQASLTWLMNQIRSIHLETHEIYLVPFRFPVRPQPVAGGITLVNGHREKAPTMPHAQHRTTAKATEQTAQAVTWGRRLPPGPELPPHPDFSSTTAFLGCLIQLLPWNEFAECGWVAVSVMLH